MQYKTIKTSQMRKVISQKKKNNMNSVALTRISTILPPTVQLLTLTIVRFEILSSNKKTFPS